eukprot:TRINITY_DN427_c0_g1_i3.p1 TRINITY_DN427_c0_g1~~TRINITY_DN427_c0_g1_i3.p1  ORF type:complete len:213 (-),score=43.44 TRINITY_DN427_c0_g1_i3:104-742(-)
MVAKKLLKEFADDSVFDALTSLKNFVTRVSNNPKEGEEFEKNVLRLATKLALHFKNNQITKDELKVFKIPMKVTASLIIKCHEEPDPNFDVARIDKHFEVLRTHMKVLCAKHLHDKSLERLQFIFKLYNCRKYEGLHDRRKSQEGPGDFGSFVKQIIVGLIRELTTPLHSTPTLLQLHSNCTPSPLLSYSTPLHSYSSSHPSPLACGILHCL